MKIQIDFDLCQGHGACAEEAPAVFALDERESRVVVLQASPPEALRAAVSAAAKFCPTHAIRITDD